VTLDAPLARNLKYNRATEVFIQWRDPDSRQVYGLTFASSEAADGFQQWIDYATNPPAAIPTRNAPVAPHTPSGESHYQRPQPHPGASKQQASNGPDGDSHQQQSVHILTDNRLLYCCYCCHNNCYHYYGRIAIARANYRYINLLFTINMVATWYMVCFSDVFFYL